MLFHLFFPQSRIFTSRLIMKKFKTRVEGYDSKEFDFECYENTEPIEIGDNYLFFFAGTAGVEQCCTENEKEEINENDRVKDDNNFKIDLVTGFWRNCYKIKTTNFVYDE